MDEEQNGRLNQDRRRWHIKKEISVGDVVAICSAALAIVYAYTTLDKRITINEQAIQNLVRINRDQDEAFVRYEQRQDQQQAQILNKLDRIIERRMP